jgi:hypothetical protein
MNFDDAIVAHTSWKNKLRTYLAKKDGLLNPAEIQSDQQCPLGQWIYGEGQKWKAKLSFGTLKARHAEFHAAAATLVRKANAGQPVDEELFLGSRSEFSKCTADVISALVKMREETK